MPRKFHSEYPIVKKRRNKFFPHDGDKNSEKIQNDHEHPLNTRRFHGTDPLKDGFDPGEDPLDLEGEEEFDPDIPF